MDDRLVDALKLTALLSVATIVFTQGTRDPGRPVRGSRVSAARRPL